MSGMEQAIDHVLNRAQAKNWQAEVLATEKTSTGASMQGGALDQFTFSEVNEIGVRIVDGRFEGVAYSESLDPESLDQMLQDAYDNSRAIEKETASELKAPGPVPNLTDIDNPAWDQIPTEEKIKAATLLEAAALKTDNRITGVPYSWYRDGRARHWIANTRGLKENFQTTYCTLLLGCLAADGDGRVSVYDREFARDFKSLQPDRLGRRAAEKALARIGARRPKTGRYTVVFENRVAEELFGLISGYFSAKAVDEKVSPLAGRLGEKIFSELISVTGDPLIGTAPASRPFDDEGYASKKTVLIENGRLNGFLTNSVYAKKMGLPHTAHGARSPESDLGIAPSNWVIGKGRNSFKDLVSSANPTILITGILGAAGFRSASGDFSLPVEGFLYENGQPQYALKDFLISGNILQVFSAIDGVADDILPPVGQIICPSLRIRDLNISGEA